MVFQLLRPIGFMVPSRTVRFHNPRWARLGNVASTILRFSSGAAAGWSGHIMWLVARETASGRWRRGLAIVAVAAWSACGGTASVGRDAGPEAGGSGGAPPSDAGGQESGASGGSGGAGGAAGTGGAGGSDGGAGFDSGAGFDGGAGFDSGAGFDGGAGDAEPATRPLKEFSVGDLGSTNEITVGPDGNLWFTTTASYVARMTLAGQVTAFLTPTRSTGPGGIAAGPDGNLWFTETAANQIGRITPSGTITEFPVPTPDPHLPGDIPVYYITKGPDGNLWFTEPASNQIGRITPSGAFKEFPIPTVNSGAIDIVTAPDGNLWFTETYAGQVARITPAGIITEFPVPNEFGPWRLVVGPDGNLWFTVNAGDERIGKMTLSGALTLFPAISYGAPLGLAVGPDGNFWFTEYNIATITRMTPDGVITRFSLPDTLGTPLGITAGPDGNLWFTAGLQGRIGRLTP
jgi:streptogramin lyase